MHFFDACRNDLHHGRLKAPMNVIIPKHIVSTSTRTLHHALPIVRNQLRYKTKSSKLWLERHAGDQYSKLAKSLQYRSRAAFKLLELDDRFKLFNKKTQNIVDLGFAPGAWTQVAIERMKAQKKDAKILGVDLIECVPPQGSDFLQGDILSRKTQTQIRQHFSPDGTDTDLRPVNLIISDMMANACGIKNADHIASMDLCDGALVLTAALLEEDGSLVMKYFTGLEEEMLVSKMEKYFKKVHRFKPKSSRPELKEMYIVGKHRVKGKLMLSDIF